MGTTLQQMHPAPEPPFACGSPALVKLGTDWRARATTAAFSVYSTLGDGMPERYLQPDWFTAHVFNPLVHWLAARGISLYGSRMLAVRGRRSGQWRTTPMNPLEFRGQRYLVAPRGVTEWVRNIRASSEGELRIGSRREPIRVVELADPEKPELLRAYLRKWKWEVGQFFEGVGPEASEEEIRQAAPRHPIFRIL